MNIYKITEASRNGLPLPNRKSNNRYVVKLRERLNLPVTWKDVLDVQYSDVRTIVQGLLSTEPAAQTVTRGTAYSYQDFALTADTLTISTGRDLPIFIDEADRYQQSYFQQMEVAAFQAKKLDEAIESLVLAEHGSWINFGATDLTNTGADDTTTIAVSSTNIDKLIRAVKRKIHANNGIEAAADRGIFFVWRPADFEFLEGFVMSAGFTEADIALKNGIPVEKAFKYMGCYHYLSNSNAANHVFAGVRRSGNIGILRSTYGKVKFLENPANSSGDLSGLGIYSRVDLGFSWVGAPNNQLSIDINVA